MKNETPLHYSIKNNSKDMFELLIAKGADINEADSIFSKNNTNVYIKKLEI